MSKDALCKKIADELTGVAAKVFDDIPNMRQLDEFFSDGMALATASIEAATWDKKDRAAGLLRSGSYLSLGISKEFVKLSDEIENEDLGPDGPAEAWNVSDSPESVNPPALNTGPGTDTGPSEDTPQA